MGMRSRLLSRLMIDPSGCLLWTGARNDDGYGQIGTTLDNGEWRTLYSHRLMYEMFVGPIPAGHQIDHLCRVRHCAAPAHLEAVTQRENLLRGNGPAGEHSRQTHCLNNHEFTEASTYRSATDGSRQCRACRRDRQRARYRRNRAAPR